MDQQFQRKVDLLTSLLKEIQGHNIDLLKLDISYHHKQLTLMGLLTLSWQDLSTQFEELQVVYNRMDTRNAQAMDQVRDFAETIKVLNYFALPQINFHTMISYLRFWTITIPLQYLQNTDCGDTKPHLKCSNASQ